MLLSHSLTRSAMRTLQATPWCRLRPSECQTDSGHTQGCLSRSGLQNPPRTGKSNSNQDSASKKQMKSSVLIKKRNSRPRNIWKLIQVLTHMIIYKRSTKNNFKWSTLLGVAKNRIGVKLKKSSLIRLLRGCSGYKWSLKRGTSSTRTYKMGSNFWKSK